VRLGQRTRHTLREGDVSRWETGEGFERDLRLNRRRNQVRLKGNVRLKYG
jgi:hypothetical protein